MNDREREIHEKLTEIDNIRKGVNQSYAGTPCGFFMGIFLLTLSQGGLFLLFGIGFIIMGIGGIIDIKWLFPKRLAKAIKNRPQAILCLYFNSSQSSK